MSEWHDGEVIEACLGDHFELFFAGGEEQGCGGGVHYLERVRIEAYKETWKAPGARAGYEMVDHIEMAAVHPIEGAHGYHGANYRRRKSRSLRHA